MLIIGLFGCTHFWHDSFHVRVASEFFLSRISSVKIKINTQKTFAIICRVLMLFCVL